MSDTLAQPGAVSRRVINVGSGGWIPPDRSPRTLLEQRVWERKYSPKAISVAKDNLEKRFGIILKDWKIRKAFPSSNNLPADQRTGPHATPDIWEFNFKKEEKEHNVTVYEFTKKFPDKTTAFVSEQVDTGNPWGYLSAVRRYLDPAFKDSYAVDTSSDYRFGVNRTNVYVKRSGLSALLQFIDGKLESFTTADYSDKEQTPQVHKGDKVKILKGQNLFSDALLDRLAEGKTLDAIATFRETVNHLDQPDPVLVFK